MKKILLLLTFIFLRFTLFSQTYNEKYSEAIEEANEYLAVNEVADALPILKKLESDGYSNANLSYKIGQCYVNSIFDKSKAINYLQKASQNSTPDYDSKNPLETKAPLRSFLLLGDAYRLNNRLKDAVNTYKHYKSLVHNDNQETALVDKRIFESQMAQLFMKRPAQVQFEKLSPVINTGLSNFNVCISGDGKTMVFNRKMKFYDAVFYSTRANGDWSEPEEITVNLGSDGDFCPTGLSSDGKRMLLTSYNQVTGYDVYESVFRDGKWRKIKLLKGSINSTFYDVDAIYGPDDKEIYFSSNRSGGIGGFDLYKVSVDAEGNTGQAANLGEVINSGWDEKSPSLTDDGNLLLFSSQRTPGMGGFDYFYSRKAENGTWGQVYNAGYPLSSVGDDLGLHTSALKSSSVTSKHDQGSSAEEDIFKVGLDNLSKFRMVPLNGEVRVSQGAGFKGLNLYFIDETINDTVGLVQNPEGGKYNIELYPGNFKLVMSKDSAGTISQPFTILGDEQKSSVQLVSDFQTKTPEQVKAVIPVSKDTLWVADVLFEFNVYTLTQPEKEKIVRLAESLKKYTISGVELLGYSDCLGKDDYNLELSARRANNVLNLLVVNGLPKNILVSKGMGRTVNFAKCTNADGSDNPEGRALNRRVVIRVSVSGDNVVVQKKEGKP